MFQAFSNFALIGDLKWSQKLFVKTEELCIFTTKIIIFKPFRIKNKNFNAHAQGGGAPIKSKIILVLSF